MSSRRANIILVGAIPRGLHHHPEYVSAGSRLVRIQPVQGRGAHPEQHPVWCASNPMAERGTPPTAARTERKS